MIDCLDTSKQVKVRFSIKVDIFIVYTEICVELTRKAFEKNSTE